MLIDYKWLLSWASIPPPNAPPPPESTFVLCFCVFWGNIYLCLVFCLSSYSCFGDFYFVALFPSCFPSSVPLYLISPCLFNPLCCLCWSVWSCHWMVILFVGLVSEFPVWQQVLRCVWLHAALHRPISVGLEAVHAGYSFWDGTDAMSLAVFPLQICENFCNFLLNVDLKNYCEMTTFPLTET